MAIRSGKPSPEDPASDDPDVERVRRMVEILKAQRLAQGLTLRQLSKSMQVDFTHISRSERGFAQPGLVILLRWCRALGMEIESLFRESKD